MQTQVSLKRLKFHPNNFHILQEFDRGLYQLSGWSLLFQTAG